MRTSISRSKEVEFRCKVDSMCSFKVRGAPSGMEEIDGSWKIARKIQLQHSCDPIAHIGKDPSISASKVSALLVPRLRQEGTIPTGIAIVTKTSEELHHQISKSSAYRAASMAKKIVYGKEEDEYNLIKPYFEELKKVNPGTIAVGMDGDHHLMLVGWGICSPENKEEWKIFQEGLKQQYGAELLEERIFSITDRQK